jgi:hypothetical protein
MTTARRLTDDERKLTRGLTYTEDGEEWVVEEIDYCEEKGWVGILLCSCAGGSPGGAR